jgi:thiamine-phosphate pyrophosphorylase
MNALPSRLLLVTDRHQAAVPLETIVAQAVSAGTRWIWFRDRDLEPAERRALAGRLLAITRRAGARLTIGGDVELAAALAADGVQLPAGAAVAAARARLGADVLIGVSAHAPGDSAAAADGGADYVTLSPIYATASKPGYGPALGPSALAPAARHGVPVLALGGLTPARAIECLQAGAAGIAVMGEIMRAPEPVAVDATVAAFARALRLPSAMVEPDG